MERQCKPSFGLYDRVSRCSTESRDLINRINKDEKKSMSTLRSKLFQNVERTIMVAIIVLLATTNVLSVTSSPFHGAMYKLFSFIPYEMLLQNSPTNKLKEIKEENQKLLKHTQELTAKLRDHRAKLSHARTISQGIAKRTAKNAATNVTSILGEALPYIGDVLVITVTAADVKDGCDTVHDVNEMLRELEAEPLDDYENEVCGMKIPSTDEVIVKIKQEIEGTTRHAKERTAESAREFYDALGGTLHEIFK